MRKRACTFGLTTLLAICVPSLGAQQPLAKSAIALQPVVLVSEGPVPQQTTASTPGARFGTRVTLGGMGWLAGLAASPYVYRVLEKMGGPDIYYSHVLVSTVAATGLAVGLVDMGDGCSTRGRIGLGVIGAATGTAAGIMLAPLTRGLSFPVGTVLMSAAVAGSCNSS